LAQKQDPVAINAWLAANPQNRRMAEVLGLNRTVQQSVEDQTFQRNQDTRAGNVDARAAEVQPITVAKLKDDLLNGPSARAAHAAQIAVANENILKSRADRANSEAQAAKALEVQRLGVALKGNMYEEGVYKDSNTVDLAKIMKDFSIGGKDEDAGKVRSDITKRLNKMAREGIPVIGSDGKPAVGPDGKPQVLPIPLGAVKAALLASTDSWGPDNFGSSFERDLRARLQSVTEKRPNNMLNAPPVMDPLGISAGSRQAPGAQNKALDDWLAFQNIARISAEVAPNSKKPK
jgi:hypothetical protein